MKLIRIRKANENDNFEEIAKCLYLTDPFIYPGAFGMDAQKAVAAIASLMRRPGNLFCPDHLVVASCEDTVCGVIAYNQYGAQWECADSVPALHALLPDAAAFRLVSERYFEVECQCPPSGQIEIVACCTMPEYRGMGIAGQVLSWLFREFPESCFTLDVLADNEAAIRLYKKHGFQICEKRKGFSMDPLTRPDCYRMIRPSNKQE